MHKWQNDVDGMERDCLPELTARQIMDSVLLSNTSLQQAVMTLYYKTSLWWF